MVQLDCGMFIPSHSEESAMSRFMIALLPTTLLLAACATPTADEAKVAAGQCNADAAQKHVGHAASAEMVEAAR